jgi:hypothetical protein
LPRRYAARNGFEKSILIPLEREENRKGDGAGELETRPLLFCILLEKKSWSAKFEVVKNIGKREGDFDGYFGHKNRILL